MKYPRTPHLPWSMGGTADDIRLVDLSVFDGKHVIVTEKLDGECTTIGQSYTHARSIDGKSHPSRAWLKNWVSEWNYRLEDNERCCGEYLFAKHSIHYSKLPSYFLGFSWFIDVNDDTICCDWRTCCNKFKTHGIEPVPVLYDGIWDEDAVKACWTGKSLFGGEQEGYVVRIRDAFPILEFGISVAKYVRPEHVQTDKHWRNAEITKNELFKKGE